MDFVRTLSLVFLALWGTLSVFFFYRIRIVRLLSVGHTNVECKGATTMSILSVFKSKPVLDDAQACSIPILDPWDKSVLPFVDHPRSFHCKKVQPNLSHVTADGYLALDLNEKKKAEELFGNELNCSYSVVKRGSTDNRLIRQQERPILEPLTRFSGDIIEVKCQSGSKDVYYNVHMHYDNRKMANSSSDEQLSVLFIFLESTSHSSMLRHLSKTYSYLKESMHADIFSGYNKVGVNTFPNLMAILTGKSTVQLPPNTRNEFPGRDFSKDFYDDYPFIWNNFSRAGYTISYDEDRFDLGPFHFGKKGFRAPYFNFSSRPFHVAIQRHPLYKRSSKFCFGNEAIANYQLKLLQDVIASSNGKKYFHTTFFVDLSHDYENDIERIDDGLVETLQLAKEKSLFNNTAVFVVGDHGARYGNVRQTDVGYFEERMPFLSVSLPTWFKKKHERIASNLEKNKRRLVTPFDLFETLSDVLQRRFSPRPRTLFERGISLFQEVPASRTCENSGIPEQFCVCYPANKISTQTGLAQQAAQAVLDHVNKLLLKEKEKCFQLQLKKLMSASEVRKNLKDDSLRMYRVVLKTAPNNALLEGLVLYSSVQLNFTIVGVVDRINRYHSQSYCTKSGLLKNYCLCRD